MVDIGKFPGVTNLWPSKLIKSVLKKESKNKKSNSENKDENSGNNDEDDEASKHIDEYV